jgi:transposase
LTCDCGGSIEYDADYIPKQIVDIQVVVDVTEERVYKGKCACCGKVHSGCFSDGFDSPVQYGPGVKAFAAMLNAYANVSINKITEIISSVTGGVISMSDGTIVNFTNALAKNLEDTVEYIKNQLIISKVLNVDETSCRVNGGLDWVHVYANSDFTLFLHKDKRGGFCDKDGVDDEFAILKLFSGILVHDHFKSFYKYTTMTHAECNAHILRYLLSIIQILAHPWATDMSDLLCQANQMKKQRIAQDFDCMGTEQLLSISTRYDEILAAGQAQYLAATEGKKNISHYNDERLLLDRLAEYKDEHLRFLTDFDAPFDNNEAERGARTIKGKIKTAGCFRSSKGADNYAEIASLISTLRKQRLNIFSNLLSLFKGNNPSFVPDPT